MNDHTLMMPAEWDARFGAVLLAWPHGDTDWAPMLPDAVRCYRDIVKALLAASQKIIIITPCRATTAAELGEESGNESISIVEVPTNDTWTRDYGPVTVADGDRLSLLDFRFNAWGMKFAANLDNQAVSVLARRGVLKGVIDCREWVLEGGSIESDGHGCLLTTSRCLMAPNRNEPATRKDIENMLKTSLGVEKVLWLNHGMIEGDDTDGHIDTLARFAPGGKILYAAPSGTGDSLQERELRMMETELAESTDIDGNPFTLVALPIPTPITDIDGSPLPATYANYLVTETAVIVPTYNRPDTDALALETIAAAHPGKKVIGVDCLPLIRQHGSLHCATMQLPISMTDL